jgi:hypothetical protein
MTGMIAIDFLAALAPTIATTNVRFEAGFIDVNDVPRPAPHDDVT